MRKVKAPCIQATSTVVNGEDVEVTMCPYQYNLCAKSKRGVEVVIDGYQARPILDRGDFFHDLERTTVSVLISHMLRQVIPITP